MDTTLGLTKDTTSVNNNSSSNGAMNGGKKNAVGMLDAPPVFVMPDGYSYMHVKRNGLIFGCATEKNVSPVVVIEVRYRFFEEALLCLFGCYVFLVYCHVKNAGNGCAPCVINPKTNHQFLNITITNHNRSLFSRSLSLRSSCYPK